MDWPRFFTLLLFGVTLFVNGYVVGAMREARWYRGFTRRVLDKNVELLAAYSRAYRILEENGLLGGDGDGPEPEHEGPEGGAS